MMKNENNTSVRKYISLAVTAIFVLSVFCACGSPSDEASTEATEAAKATVTAGEAAEKASQGAAQDGVKHAKTGTEDGAIDAAKVAAYQDIEGYDGKWENMSIDVGDTITTIEFDWNNNHYKYEYDQTEKRILK